MAALLCGADHRMFTVQPINRVLELGQRSTHCSETTAAEPNRNLFDMAPTL